MLPWRTQDAPPEPSPASANDELQAFVYTISHDLGAPLRAVVSFSDMLAEKYAGKLDERGLRYLEFVLEGGHKAQAMLAGLLEYSRVATQAAPFAPVECGRVVGRCLHALADQIKESEAKVEVGPMPYVMGDGAQIFQVFAALLTNALTYHRPDAPPHIRLLAWTEGDHWKIAVRDNGIGVDPRFVGRIFEMFKRLHTDEEYPGAGMGLTLARRIVERHGGAIGCQPAEGGGTEFWFTLPQADD